MLIVTDATWDHVTELAETMQELDKLSIKLLTGETPLDGLVDSCRQSLHAEAWMLDGRVAAISGVSKPTLLSDWACPWLLCSDVIRTVPRRFLEATKAWTMDELEQHGKLINYTYTEHKRSLRWLEWLGFTVYPAEPRGPYNALFHKDELIWAKH